MFKSTGWEFEEPGQPSENNPDSGNFDQITMGFIYPTQLKQAIIDYDNIDIDE
jgi:hypothetical protein